MCYNICVNCGTNLNHLLAIFIIEKEMFKSKVKNALGEDELEENVKLFNNLFFVKNDVDRLCCRAFFITFNDYVPSSI